MLGTDTFGTNATDTLTHVALYIRIYLYIRIIMILDLAKNADVMCLTLQYATFKKDKTIFVLFCYITLSVQMICH